MTPLRQHMRVALQRSGKSERPHQTAVREGRLLAQCYGTSPDLLAEQQRQHDVLHRKTGAGLSPRSLRICYRALRFFSHHVLARPWKPLELLRAQTAPRLPAVRSLPAVHRLLKALTPWHQRVYCTTLSRGGLRLNDALSLQGGASDGPRPMRPGHRGQGAQDRCLPRPDDTLDLGRP